MCVGEKERERERLSETRGREISQDRGIQFFFIFATKDILLFFHSTKAVISQTN